MLKNMVGKTKYTTMNFICFYEGGFDMKFKPEDLSVEFNRDTGKLFATALAWVIGEFDENSMSWVEYKKPEFMELDSSLILAPEETIEAITNGILPSPKDFQRWIE